MNKDCLYRPSIGSNGNSYHLSSPALAIDQSLQDQLQHQRSQLGPLPHGLGSEENWSYPSGYQALKYRYGISRNATLEALVHQLRAPAEQLPYAPMAHTLRGIAML
jgi:hypothetical protein